jgi:hypothetical protein
MAGIDYPTADLPHGSPHLDSSAFVGRDELLQRCNRSVKQARNGQSTFLMLAGESGVGKIRLAAEVLDTQIGISDTLGVDLSGDLYALSAKYRGIGVRLEDDVLVPAKGSRCLSDVPRDSTDVEAWMAELWAE